MEIWKRNLLFLSFAQFLVMAAMNQIMPFLPLYLHQELGVSDKDSVNLWAGLIFGINFLSALVFSPVWGNLADRFGRKIMILRSGFGMAVITGAMGLVQSPEQLLVLRLLNGVISGFIPASIALVSTNTPKERVGFALGTLQAGGVAGSILGPAFGGLLADLFGFRTIFYLTGILLFLATILVTFMVVEINKPNPKAKNGEGWIKDFQRIVSTKPLPVLFGTGFLIQFALISTMQLLSVYVQELTGDTPYLAFFAGLVMSVTGVANMVASPVLGKLGDRYGSQQVLFFCLLGSGLAMLPHAFVTNIWQLIVLRFVLGLCVGGLLPSINALIRHYAPEGMESRTYGYSNSAVFMGNMLGPIVGAYLSTVIHISGVFIFASVMLFLNFFWVRVLVRGKMDAATKSGRLPSSDDGENNGHNSSG